jgi:hypothetical protein
MTKQGVGTKKECDKRERKLRKSEVWTVHRKVGSKG